MSQIDEAINSHEERCFEELPKKFVSWVWVVGLFVGLAAAIGGTVWGLSSQISDTTYKANEATRILEQKREKDAEQDIRLTKLEMIQETQAEILEEVKAVKEMVKRGNR